MSVASSEGSIHPSAFGEGGGSHQLRSAYCSGSGPYTVRVTKVRGPATDEDVERVRLEPRMSSGTPRRMLRLSKVGGTSLGWSWVQGVLINARTFGILSWFSCTSLWALCLVCRSTVTVVVVMHLTPWFGIEGDWLRSV